MSNKILKEDRPHVAALGNATDFFAAEPESLRTLRAAAYERFAALGYPGREREEWKYNVLALAELQRMTPLGAEAGDLAAEAVTSLRALAGDAPLLVFVDGIYRPQQSALGELPAGLELTPLTGGECPAELGAVAQTEDAAFAALNTAFWRDGVAVRMAAGARLDGPLELLFVTTPAAHGHMVSPRTLIVAESGSEVTVLENYVSVADEPLLTNPLTEVICAGTATVNHLKLLREGDRSWHVGSTHVRQDAASVYRSREFILGSEMARRELHVALAGAEAHCDLGALYLGSGSRRRDLRTRIDHQACDCNTSTLYKGILGDRSRGVFDGQIRVAPGASGTDARQTNRNLLLSDDATANSIPRLEIYNDQVQCTHGSTTGQIAEEQLFYLRARGFDPEAARAILTHAFAAELLEDLEPPALRELLSDELLRRLPRGELIEALS